MSMDTTDAMSKLQAELDEVSRREASFRLKTVQDHLAVEAKLRELTKKVDELNAYVHELHVERDQLKSTIQKNHGDIETLTWMLNSFERDATALQAVKQSFVWPLASGIAKSSRKPAPTLAKPSEFHYFLHTSPYRVYRGNDFTLRGWLLPKNGKAVTAIRVRIDDRAFHGKIGLEEPDVIKQQGPQANNPRPGFEVTFATPPGRHDFALEAQIENADWYLVLHTPIWSKADGK